MHTHTPMCTKGLKFCSLSFCHVPLYYASTCGSRSQLILIIIDKFSNQFIQLSTYSIHHQNIGCRFSSLNTYCLKMAAIKPAVGLIFKKRLRNEAEWTMRLSAVAKEPFATGKAHVKLCSSFTVNVLVCTNSESFSAQHEASLWTKPRRVVNTTEAAQSPMWEKLCVWPTHV